MKNIIKYIKKNKVIIFIILIILLILSIFYLLNSNKSTEYFTDINNNMQKYNVIFGGTVKNVEPYIDSILKHIDQCGKKFKSYSLVIYENDSTDNTRKILMDNKKDNYHYIFEEGITEQRRTIRLANGRNKLVEKVKELNQKGEYTYFILMDMDDRNSSGKFIDSIDTCFKYHYNDWDVLTGNQTKKYYDTWALRKNGLIDYDCWGEYFKPTTSEEKKEEINHIIENTVFEKNGLLEVDSAFGGIAIYKIEAINDCKYIGEYKNNEYPEHNNELCEHVEFHKCIKNNGGKIFINTEFYND
jgi:uncharacterized protein YpmB